MGAEAPVILENCQLGRKVSLKGGFYSESVFLDGANMGSGAHIRAGTLLEEEANGAHTVGLKQTILQPFVTLGSLINFCDVMMSGGTSRKDHSEVGSSYIHFNFTPHQDKATASLVGEVPRGVFLRERPIFLGGQGGLVGPARVEYGCVIAAGSVLRKDMLEADKLHLAGGGRALTMDYDLKIYSGVDRIVFNNLAYIGNVIALKAWYENVRVRFMNRDANDKACFDGAISVLNLVLKERIKRLSDLADKMADSVSALKEKGADSSIVEEQERLVKNCPMMAEHLKNITISKPTDFLSKLPETGGDYISVIKSLDETTCSEGTNWLQTIVDSVTSLWTKDF